jgi:hypothetical protein
MRDVLWSAGARGGASGGAGWGWDKRRISSGGVFGTRAGLAALTTDGRTGCAKATLFFGRCWRRCRRGCAGCVIMHERRDRRNVAGGCRRGGR